jgi:hypothetical protein
MQKRSIRSNYLTPWVSYLQKPGRLRYATTGHIHNCRVAFPMHAFKTPCGVVSTVKHFPCKKNKIPPMTQLPKNAIIIKSNQGIYPSSRYELGQCCCGLGLGGLLLLLYCLGALGRRCALDCRLPLCCLGLLGRLLLSLVRLWVVTLRRILSPHALVPNVSIIMSD